MIKKSDEFIFFENELEERIEEVKIENEYRFLDFNNREKEILLSAFVKNEIDTFEEKENFLNSRKDTYLKDLREAFENATEKEKEKNL